MKKLLITLLLIQFNFSIAGGSPELVASPEIPSFNTPIINPIAGQDFSFWRSFNCTIHNDSHLVINDNHMDVFIFGSSVVISPCPPPAYIQVTNVNGVNTGTYTFNYYWVPSGDTFPPAVADYASYLVEQSFFTVLGSGISTVDSHSIWSLSLLIFAILLVGVFVMRNARYTPQS